MTIAVTGATGQLGRLAIAALKARGATPIALARSPEKAADLGVEVRAFDYDAADPAALAGIDTLVLISANEIGKRAPQHKAAIAAAKAAGVKRILYTSLLKADAGGMKLGQEHLETEAALKASGIPATVLRNGWYTENHTGTLPGAIAAGALIGSSGEGRIASASRADFAEAIAVTATGEGHAGQTYELAGDTAFTMAEYAAEVSRLTGRTIPYNNLPEAEYASILGTFGLPPVFAGVLADSDARAATGALHDDSHTLSRLIGRPTTPWQQTVAAAVRG
jgi:NAD(P)H dehydrogenase (quinone)